MRSVPWWWLPAACVPCQRVLQMPVEDDEVQDDDVEEDEDEDYTEDEVSWQDLCKRPLGKISVPDVYQSSVYKTSISVFLGKLSSQALYEDFLVKISAQDLLDYQNEHRATARATRQAQSAERVA
eukprot:s1541_g19.t2